MIIYNVTINIEEDIEQDWLDWMKAVHIPQVMETGFFTGHNVYKIISSPMEDDGVSYCVQYFCDKLEDYETYHNEYAEELQKLHNQKFGGKFTAVRTILREV